MMRDPLWIHDRKRRFLYWFADLGPRYVITLVLLAIVALLCLVGIAAAAPWPNTYDEPIREAWERYHPGDDWRWWKSQLWQESHLDPNARSPVGAEGLAQFMPATAKEVWPLLGLGLVDRRMAEPSIIAGAYYMRNLMRFWKAPRSLQSRRRYAQASYNAGAGGVHKAQKRCGEPAEYPPIVRCLPSESRIYVERIERWHGMMQ